MSKIQEIKELMEQFESIKTIDENGEERWTARDLQKSLGYTKWQRFDEVIEKAKEIFLRNGGNIERHFTASGKLGKSSLTKPKIIKDYILSKEACYFIAMECDARKDEVRFAKTYFVVQVRTIEQIQEKLLESIKDRIDTRKALAQSESLLNSVALERKMTKLDIAKMQDKGNKAFFGGKTTNQIKKQLKTGGRPIADFADPAVLAGKILANRGTAIEVEEKNVQGKNQITSVHINKSEKARNAVFDVTSKFPEEFPPQRDIKKVIKEHKKK